MADYLIYWNELNRNFYENAIKTNEQWFKLWDPWLKAGNPQRRKKIKVEYCNAVIRGKGALPRLSNNYIGLTPSDETLYDITRLNN